MCIRDSFKVDNLGFKKSKAFFGNIGIKAIDWVRKTANEALAESRHFHPTADIRDLAKICLLYTSVLPPGVWMAPAYTMGMSWHLHR